MIDQNQYLKDRIDDQIAWYGKRSRENKNWYTRLRIASIIISLSIPILTGLIGQNGGRDDFMLKMAISLAGALVAFNEGLMSLKKYHDLWTTYRATVEGLRYHRYLFETSAAPYNVPGAFQLFVQNSESLMASERSKWIQVASPESSKGDKGQGGAGQEESENSAEGQPTA